MALLNKAGLRAAHRWLGLVFSLFVFLAAGSGILHNLMSATQKPPPRPAPTEPFDPDLLKVAPREAARVLAPGSKLSALSIRKIGNEPWYQLYAGPGEQPAYVSAVSGLRDEHADERYAAQIASAYLVGSPVRKTAFLTAYDKEYISIFRILPVYRFDAEDGLGTRVYVSTMTGSVTRATDDRKQFEADVFSLLHKFAFIPDKTWRNALLTLTTAGLALTAFCGVILFLWPRGTSARLNRRS